MEQIAEYVKEHVLEAKNKDKNSLLYFLILLCVLLYVFTLQPCEKRAHVSLVKITYPGSSSIRKSLGISQLDMYALDFLFGLRELMYFLLDL